MCTCTRVHVRDFDLRRVVCVYYFFSLHTTTSGVFWENNCCWQLREEVLMVAGVCRQRCDVGVDDGGGGDVSGTAEMSYLVNPKVLC